MADVRVRIAPSPTGIPHIGNTRTALFNYLFAKHNKGKFILRIEDTDRARLVEGAEEKIKEILEWLGLAWDEFYKQSERLAIYKKAADELLRKGLAHREEAAIRFIVPKDKTVSWTDSVGNKNISFKTDDIEDFIILKSDGFPTYHLGNVVDDHEMKITYVIRGDEWISSTPKHILLYQAFGWELPVFAHLPVILGPDKTKLSKRHGAQSILEYRDEGYLKEALLNFMVLLGWNPGGDREIMTINEMIKLFDLKDVNTNTPVFDINKLTWFNGYYIRKSKISNLKSQILSQSPKLKKVDDALLDKLIGLAQTRMKTLNDFYELVNPFLDKPKLKLNAQEKAVAEKLKEKLSTIEQWNNETILAAIMRVISEEKTNMPVIYKVLTGSETGLPLPDMLAILGKEYIMKRL